MRPTHYMDTKDLSKNEYDVLFGLADDIFSHPDRYIDRLRGKVLASLFFEPSTRTRMSFETAMLRLGGSVIHMDSPDNSSMKKGESLEDTLRIVESYADVCVMRHPVSFTQHKLVPYLKEMHLINAGDGNHSHPTQTLTDLMTIRHTKGRLDHLKIGLCGDLKNGRTVHSLFRHLKEIEGNHFTFISPPGLEMPEEYFDGVDKNSYVEIQSLEEGIEDLDILYMTRVQTERFASEEEGLGFRGSYALTKKILGKGKEDLSIMHPLPRVDEIETEIDEDPRAHYFLQAKLGMIVRMALILFLMEDENGKDS
ncbi:aspartate carbamoyltransferase [Peptoniphilus sp. KCTC 25270]|uniref:aspartate carbamoyltransferase n=1 Tax=Peptoniphilus sp. KCTC 25270 TaxID=2897414 RepID=UPI001E519CF6|nr:aspartate carbamoyltransferase [Peptoniphilus sp. KCTC 25270]MCD1146731.1 aspartate carbamoyltransferase [Peptoniphilus sp. KCTC 25270]